MAKENSHFRFKQFSISHGNASMKIGTDGVLLGCWVDVSGSSNILDIGTGSGVIALMLAQRTPSDTVITGIDISEKDAQQAIENVRISPWPKRVTIEHVPVQEFNPGEQYDLIVSNPPFFVNSFPPPDLGRMGARHTVTLSFDDLAEAVVRLLSLTGKFSLILPPVEGAIFRELALEKKLFCSRLWHFRSKKEKPVERLLMEFTRLESEPERGEIIMYGDDNTWTQAFRELSGEFYLKA